MSDPNPQGGSITDMAVEGTHVDPKAAEPRTIPSKPNPHQAVDQSDLGAPDMVGAADNMNDISRVRLPLPSPRLTTFRAWGLFTFLEFLFAELVYGLAALPL